jgi:uncharacterized lipoprotein YehR (DUF1307 family)
MELSKSAKLFLSHCYKDGAGVSIILWFKNTYTINEADCKFTKEIFEELKLSGFVKVINETEKIVNICGFKEMPKFNKVKNED